MTTITNIPDLIQLTPEARQVLDGLRAAGGRPLIVGGSVRDALLSRARGVLVDSKDIDIEVYGLTTAQVSAALPGYVMEVGQQFGIVSATVNGQVFDVSLPRQESEAEAFARRDFTINAMGWDDLSGTVVDPFGGQIDLSAGILRHTSPAFSDDPLRVLRAMQFSGRFGFRLLPETAELCRSLSPAFQDLPRTRIWGEFYKLASKGVYISEALETLFMSGWEEHFPELAATRGVPQDPEWHPEGDVNIHLGLAGDQAARIARRDNLGADETAALVLAAITHDFGKAVSTTIDSNGRITSNGHNVTGVEPARSFLRRIGAPGRYEDKILPLIREHMCHTPEGPQGVISDSAVRRLVRRLNQPNGGPSIKDWARLVEADKEGRGPGARQGVNHLPTWLAKAERLGKDPVAGTTLLKGAALAEEDIPRGRLWHFVIEQSRDAQDDGLFSDEAGAAAWLHANRDAVVAEALRRLDEFEAAGEKSKATGVAP
ncbi:tRNA nucleotidyltransferase (CCA-adding enzyme) [Paenarthrobacter nicotinovorans]|uniref:CCA tRNA nucleotidyltransferase n=1 Tax=Micrococcaceae TaxID=1268 RepID=UPI000876D583|nr:MULTISPECIES: HD domain-containing protein [Micrococcaceae]MDR6435068.1 tRNA nucleotidyltransferase (CCA-adding enzyme) [Paenarthrobacter nicotinovorans]SCZ58937.1 tRNA nucleotidyltransferase (CCA-adding enzyme) [Arthrobacter sp. UNCCL28]